MNKPIIVFVTEIDLKNRYKPIRYIRFPLDDGKHPMCYRSRTSYSSFACGLKQRNYSPNKKHAKLFYYCQIEAETSSFYEIPIIDVNNIWDFYKLIGYNYKTKKYNQIK